jgi:thioredoxin reductase (NADPH)
MPKPALFIVDDEPEVLSAVERDVRREFGKDYRLLKAESGLRALEALKKLKLREAPVALFLVDQRMPVMTGVEFLAEAMQLYPDAKRVLLTAYADTEAAIRAINTIRLDHYLLKPWDPPEERLYPVLHDLLDDWQAAYHPQVQGLRVVGHRWTAKSHAIKEFLTRNQIPYRWLEAGDEEEARRLLVSAGTLDSQLPVVILPDGTVLPQPTNVQLAERVGLKTHAGMPFYDLIIVGAGPAGLAAAVYGASEGLDTLIIEREAPGGQAGMSSRIENYLGFPVGLSGGDLARRAVAQARRFGAELLTPQEVCGLRVRDTYRFVRLADNTELSCHTLLIATGVSYRQLEAPGVEALAGAGVYYGSAMTEALACRDKDVYIVGGGNSAAQSAIYLARHARTVTMLLRGDSLAASTSRYLVDRLREIDNVTIRPYTTVVEAQGENDLEAITLDDLKQRQRQTVAADALFVFIGAAPRTEWVDNVVERDEQGYIRCGPPRAKSWPLERDPYFLESSVPGIFVAGDVRQGSMKRIASAVGEGAMAVYFIHQYLATL